MPSSFDIPDECLVEMGRVIVAWNQLESILDMALIKLLCMGDTEKRGHTVAAGFIVFAHMSVPMKMQALRALLVLTNDPKNAYIKTFDKVISVAVTKALGKRNEVVHSRIVTHNGTATLIRTLARGELEFSVEYLTAKDMASVHKQIALAKEHLGAHLQAMPEVNSAKRTKPERLSTALQALVNRYKPVDVP